MLRKTVMLSLLSSPLLGVISLPAQADNATVQTSTQQVVINGNNNQVIQVINQTNIIDHPGRGNRRRNGGGNRNNRATVQDAYQGASVNGGDNRIIQQSNQETVERGLRGRGRRNDPKSQRREDWEDDEPIGRQHQEEDENDE